MNNVFVGEDIILPRSPRSQNAHPYAIKTKNFYLVRRGDHRSSVCSGFSQNILKRVILSEQRVASRTFGFVSGNIANKSKSENCQDNFRDLLRFILSFWLKSNILCRVGLHLTLLQIPHCAGKLLVRLFSPLRMTAKIGCGGDRYDLGQSRTPVPTELIQIYCLDNRRMCNL